MSSKSRKQARLCFLLSRLNLEYLNELEGSSNSPKYSPLISQNYIPSYFKETELRLQLFFCVVSIALLFRLFLRIIVIVLKKVVKGNLVVCQKKIYLLTSSAMPRIVKLAKIDTSDGVWLDLPRKKSILKNEKIISSVAIIGFRHILWSVIDVIIGYFILLKKKGYKHALEVKGGFDWFLYYWSLQRISSDAEIYFCNQIDHWTSLIDKSPQRIKIHLQHGTIFLRKDESKIRNPIYTYMDKYNIITLNVPYKMRNVSKAYSFSEIEYASECKSFLNGNQSHIIIGYPLKVGDLTPVNNQRKSVLIIAYYFKYRFIEEELLLVLQNLDIDIYLKNHPTVPLEKYSKMQSAYSFQLINGAVFPKTDIVLSYDSTLAKEYESLGFKVIYYDDKSVHDVLCEVKFLLSENNN